MVFLDGGVAELVAFGLAGLSEQDQRCGVGRLGRECEVEQDEWLGVPPEAERGGVDSDPENYQYGLPNDEARRTKKRAKRSAVTPKRSLPNAPWWTR